MATVQTTTRRVVSADVPVTSAVSTEEYVGFKIYQVVYYILGIIETLLLFRFILRALGANSVGVAQLLYDVSYPFMAPFQGIFAVSSAGGAVFDWSILVAMAVYAFLAYIFAQLIRIMTSSAE